MDGFFPHCAEREGERNRRLPAGIIFNRLTDFLNLVPEGIGTFTDIGTEFCNSHKTFI